MKTFIIGIYFANVEKKTLCKKILIMIVTTIVQINKKNTKNNYNILLNFKKIKSEWF